MKTSRIKILLSLLCLLLVAGSNKAFSQCSYVISGTANDTTISIPCDFPVYMNTGSINSDMVTFNNSVQIWNTANPGLSHLAQVPTFLPSVGYIAIPATTYSLFSALRKESILSTPHFYHIIQ